jgi:prolyl 4-hydroxylase
MDMPTALHRALVRRLADGPRGLETEFDHMFTYGGIHNWATRPNEAVPLDAGTKNEVLEAVSSPMQWWAGQRLRHTSTYGIRIYRRGAMMLEHYDRRETHHVSAVLQVAQSGCDAGWPLEVLDARGGGASEVFLQPGQMALYLGAHFKHGRPMRSPCDSFANVFVHAAPRFVAGREREFLEESGL